MPKLQLSYKQMGAVAGAQEKLNNGVPAVITGPAGSGKSSLLVELAAAFPGCKVYTPTNKAKIRTKEVLRASGMDDVECKTLHSAVLKPERSRSTAPRGVHTIGGAQEDVDFLSNEKSVSHPVIIDEGGMVDSALRGAILAHARGGLIVLGDANQLHPVQAGESLLESLGKEFGEYKLTEIFRQGDGGSLVECLKMLVDGGDIDEAISLLPTVTTADAIHMAAYGNLVAGKYGDVPIIAAQHRKHLLPLNSAVRAYRDLEEWPVKGEVLLVRKGGDLSMYAGGWKLATNEEVTVVRAISEEIPVNYLGAEILARQYMVRDVDKKIHLILVFHFPGDEEQVALALKIVSGKWVIDDRRPANDNGGKVREISPMTVIQRQVKEIAGGPWAAYCDVADSYARTCHSTQGSEWDNVIVVPEAIGDRRRWLYTAISRAKKQAFILKGQE